MLLRLASFSVICSASFEVTFKKDLFQGAVSCVTDYIPVGPKMACVAPSCSLNLEHILQASAL